MPLPDLPNPQVGAGYEFKGQHRSTSFDGGSRLQRQTRARPNIVSIKWRLSEAQRAALEAFHRSQGVTPFQINLPAINGWQKQQVRFADKLSFSYLGVEYWECSTKLLLLNPQYLTKDQLAQELIDMLGSWDDLSFVSKLDTLVNVTLPSYWNP